MFGIVIWPAHFVRGLFCYSNFNFFYTDNKEETNYYNFKHGTIIRTESLLQLHQIFLLSIRSCCRRSNKESFLLTNFS